MLCQIQLKPLLAVLLSSGLMSAVNIQIPKNLEARDVLVLGSEALAENGNLNQSQRNNFQNAIQASSQRDRATNADRKPVQTRSQQSHPSGRSQPIQTRSYPQPQRRTNVRRTRVVQTRSHPNRTSEFGTNKPAPTRSYRFQNASGSYSLDAPHSHSTDNRNPNFSTILTPKLSQPNALPDRSQVAPNKPRTEFESPRLPKTPNLYQPEKGKTQPYKSKIQQNSPDLIEFPTTSETLPLKSPEFSYPINSSENSLEVAKPNSFVAGLTKLVQILAVSCLGIPIWILLLRLKKNKIPSSSGN